MSATNSPNVRPPRAASGDTQATLLERLRDGADSLAWTQFFDRYGPLVFALARRLGCQEHSAEEIVQDVMLTVFQGRRVFQYDPSRGRFRDWLATVVRNAVARRRRAPAQRIRGRGGETGPGAIEPDVRLPAPADDLQAAYEDGLLGVLLDMVRRETAPATFQAFELTVIHDLPGSQVAEITGLSRNAVYKARARVLQRLQELGAPYRETGQLGEGLKRAAGLGPAPEAFRSLKTRIEQSAQSNGADR